MPDFTRIIIKDTSEPSKKISKFTISEVIGKQYEEVKDILAGMKLTVVDSYTRDEDVKVGTVRVVLMLQGVR